MEIKPGSMGLPMPGQDVCVIDDEGNEQPAGSRVTSPSAASRLALSRLLGRTRSDECNIPWAVVCDWRPGGP